MENYKIYLTDTDTILVKGLTLDHAFRSLGYSKFQIVDIGGGFYHIFTSAKVMHNDNIYLAEVLTNPVIS